MSHLGAVQNPLRIAIIGSGPSGYYTAEALIRSGITVDINMLERLPNPYGLVRSGVAPDHPKLKQAIDVYAKISDSPQINFIGNVKVGKDITVDELTNAHHVVIFTCGAESDRKLGIPGEDLAGSHTATEFVGWYNGHPNYRDRTFDLSHETAVIIGQGNVAADVSRILAKTVDELKHTDIAQHALDVLAESKICNIYVIGRRGSAQAKFTSKELKEFAGLDDCEPIIDPNELILNPESETELSHKNSRGNKKVYEIFNDYAQRTKTKKTRRCYFSFLKSPVEIIGNSKVEYIILENNKLTGDPFQQSAKGTGETFKLEAGIIFRSIGYRGIAITGVPFDDRRGIFPNDNGRIIDNNANPIPQLYCAGWIKRGPTGIIGTNRADSVATVKSLLEDIQVMTSSEKKSGAEEIYKILDERNIRHVNFSQWNTINQSEIERGKNIGKPREKFTYIEEMLALLD